MHSIAFNRPELLNFFAHIETQRTALARDLRTNECELWPLYRMFLYGIMQRGSAPPTPTKSAVANLGGKLWSCGKAMLADRANNAPVAPCDVVLFSNTMYRMAKLNSGYYDVWCGPLIDAFAASNISTLLLEQTPTGVYRLPRSQPSQLLQGQLLLAKLKTRLFFRSSIPTQLKQTLGELSAELARTAWPFPLPSPYDFWGMALTLFQWQDLFCSLLQRTRPKIVCLTCYYCLEGLALVSASRKLGIPSVDVQHGVIVPVHAAYAGWKNLPPQGYDLLPDQFWCWSDDAAQTINAWSKECSIHKALVVGNLWNDMWQDHSNRDVAFFDARIAKDLLQDRPGLRIVLFSLQTEVGLPEALREAIAATKGRVLWLLRLHPAMLPEKERYRRSLNAFDHVELDLASSLPLPALLRHIDLHITGFSTVVIEAANFGVPSLVISAIGPSVFPQAMANGTCSFAEDAGQIVDAIYRAKKFQAPGKEQKLPPAARVSKLYQGLIAEI